MNELDARVAEVAVGQHGLITIAQAREAGAKRGHVRRRRESARWVKVEHNVFRIAGSPVTWRSQLLACILAAGGGAMASHRSAGVLWNLDGCRTGKPELVVPRGQRYRRAGVRTHESTDLHLVVARARHGIPVTPVARTLLDLGAVLPRDKVHLALDDARRRKLVDWDELLATLVAHARRGRDGVGTLRAILDDHFGEIAVTGSGFERLVVSLLTECGFPRPVLQHEVRSADRIYRLDLAYLDRKVAIELDGRVHLRHDVWEDDHARQNALVLAGWTVLRFTWNDYLNRRGDMLAEVRAVLRP